MEATLPLPLPPQGISADDLRAFGQQGGIMGAREYFTRVDAIAATLASEGERKQYQGEALENLVRAVLTFAPESLLPGRRIAHVAATSRRRYVTGSPGWDAEALWRADRATLATIEPTHAAELEDSAGFKFDIVGIALTATGRPERFVVQCKDRDGSVDSRDSTDAASPWPGQAHVARRLLIGHRDAASAAAQRRSSLKGVEPISREQLCELIPGRFWRPWADSLEMGRVQVRADNDPSGGPTKHQMVRDEAAQSVLAAYRSGGHHRATLAMVTGAGKTAAAIDVAAAITTERDGGRVVFAVPRINLLEQVITECSRWLPPTLRPHFGVVGGAAALPPRLRREGDTLREAAIFRAETPEALAAWWAAPVGPGEVRVVATTYHSSPQLRDITQGTPADLLVVDEAHHLAGPRESTGVDGQWYSRSLLDDDQLRATRRLFLTATPRLEGPIDPIDPSAGVSMRSEQYFGPIAYTLTYERARELGIVKPFRLVVDVLVDDPTLPTSTTALSPLLRRDVEASVSTSEHGITFSIMHAPDGTFLPPETPDLEATARTARSSLHAMLVARAMALTGTKSAVAFYGRVADARAVAEQLKTVSAHVLAEDPTRRAGLGLGEGEGIEGASVVSGDREEDRQTAIRKANQADRPIVLTTCHALGEGADLPGVGMAIIASPHHSPEAIIQKVGRSARRGVRGSDATDNIIYVPVLGRLSPDGDVILDDEKGRRTVASVQETLRGLDAGFAEFLESHAAELEAAIQAGVQRYWAARGDAAGNTPITGGQFSRIHLRYGELVRHMALNTLDIASEIPFLTDEEFAPLAKLVQAIRTRYGDGASGLKLYERFRIGQHWAQRSKELGLPKSLGAQWRDSMQLLKDGKRRAAPDQLETLDHLLDWGFPLEHGLRREEQSRRRRAVLMAVATGRAILQAWRGESSVKPHQAMKAEGGHAENWWGGVARFLRPTVAEATAARRSLTETIGLRQMQLTDVEEAIAGFMAESRWESFGRILRDVMLHGGWNQEPGKAVREPYSTALAAAAQRIATERGFPIPHGIEPNIKAFARNAYATAVNRKGLHDLEHIPLDLDAEDLLDEEASLEDTETDAGAEDETEARTARPLKSISGRVQTASRARMILVGSLGTVHLHMTAELRTLLASVEAELQAEGLPGDRNTPEGMMHVVERIIATRPASALGQDMGSIEWHVLEPLPETLPLVRLLKWMKHELGLEFPEGGSAHPLLRQMLAKQAAEDAAFIERHIPLPAAYRTDNQAATGRDVPGRSRRMTKRLEQIVAPAVPPASETPPPPPPSDASPPRRVRRPPGPR